MQNGKNQEIVEKIVNWLNNNGESMFNEFMASSPDQKRLLFIHKWYEIDKFKDEQPRISAKKLN